MADEREIVRSRIDIVDLIGQRVRLKKSGRTWTGLCPFHEDRNPSFSVSPDIGRYKCWSCGASGDVFTWVMETQGLEFRDALELLAKQAGVELTGRGRHDKSKRQAMADAMSAALAFFRENLKTHKRALAYCQSRGLGQETLDAWEIGYAPDVGEALAIELKKKGFALSDCKELFLVDGSEQLGYGDRFRGRLMFPIRDDQGHLVAFGGRIIGDGQPKYINSSDTPIFSKGRTLYGMHRAKDSVRAQKQAVLVEGYLDVIACHRAGVTNAVASLGTALSEQNAKRLAMWCDEVVILYDSDDAGQKAAERATELFAAVDTKVRVALMPKGQDPDTLLREQGREAVQQAVKGGLEPIEFLLRQAEARHSPEQQEYWDEAAVALARLPNALEVERHLMPLAAKYPFLKDPVRAANALRAMVRRAARKKQEPNDPATHSAEESKPKSALAMPPLLEAEPFRALKDEALREAAWTICTDESLFLTASARRLANAVRHAWPDSPPEGDTATFIDQVADEQARELLVTLFMSTLNQREKRPANDGGDFKEPPLTRELIDETRARLITRRDNIEVRSSATASVESDDALRDLDAKLRRLKGVQVAEKEEEPEDPFA